MRGMMSRLGIARILAALVYIREISLHDLDRWYRGDSVRFAERNTSR